MVGGASHCQWQAQSPPPPPSRGPLPPERPQRAHPHVSWPPVGPLSGGLPRTPLGRRVPPPPLHRRPQGKRAPVPPAMTSTPWRPRRLPMPRSQSAVHRPPSDSHWAPGRQGLRGPGRGRRVEPAAAARGRPPGVAVAAKGDAALPPGRRGSRLELRSLCPSARPPAGRALARAGQREVAAAAAAAAAVTVGAAGHHHHGAAPVLPGRGGRQSGRLTRPVARPPAGTSPAGRREKKGDEAANTEIYLVGKHVSMRYVTLRDFRSATFF